MPDHYPDIPTVSPEHLAKKRDSIHSPRRQLSIVATNGAIPLPRFTILVLRLALPWINWLLRFLVTGQAPSSMSACYSLLGADPS